MYFIYGVTTLKRINVKTYIRLFEHCEWETCLTSFFFHNLVWKMFGFVWFFKIFGFLCLFRTYPPIPIMEFHDFIQAGKTRSANVMRHFNIHIWSVFHVGEFGLFFSCFFAHKFPFSSLYLFSSLLHLLHPPRLVLVPSFCFLPTLCTFSFSCCLPTSTPISLF